MTLPSTDESISLAGENFHLGFFGKQRIMVTIMRDARHDNA
jgi:hypothetical protein